MDAEIEHHLAQSADSLRAAISSLYQLDTSTRDLPSTHFTALTSDTLPSRLEHPDPDLHSVIEQLLSDPYDTQVQSDFLSQICGTHLAQFTAQWLYSQDRLPDDQTQSLQETLEQLWAPQEDEQLPITSVFSSDAFPLITTTENLQSNFEIIHPCPPATQPFVNVRVEDDLLTLVQGPSIPFIVLALSIVALMGVQSVKVTLGGCRVRISIQMDDQIVVTGSFRLLAVDGKLMRKEDRRIRNLIEEEQVEDSNEENEPYEEEEEDDDDDDVEESTWKEDICWSNSYRYTQEEEDSEQPSYHKPHTTSWADVAAAYDTSMENDQQQPEQEEDEEISPTPCDPPISIDDAIDTCGGSLKKAVYQLWRLDVNRLAPGKDYILNPQSKSDRTDTDQARSNLFVSISSSVWRRPTYKTFKSLLDNYTAETGTPERVSELEEQEEETFLQTILPTPCIQFCKQWLYTNEFIECDDDETFLQMLHDIWFKLYRRDASRDSSGFEHVFCGEIDDGKVKGMHNFIQIYLEEQRGHFDYKGYLDIYGRDTHIPPPVWQQILLIRFEWLGCLKNVSSMFVGTSPEFELAVYTMYFLAKKSGTKTKVGPYHIRVKAHDLDGMLGSSYPDLLEVDLNMLREERPDTETADEDVY